MKFTAALLLAPAALGAQIRKHGADAFLEQRTTKIDPKCELCCCYMEGYIEGGLPDEDDEAFAEHCPPCHDKCPWAKSATYWWGHDYKERCPIVKEKDGFIALDVLDFDLDDVMDDPVSQKVAGHFPGDGTDAVFNEPLAEGELTALRACAAALGAEDGSTTLGSPQCSAAGPHKSVAAFDAKFRKCFDIDPDDSFSMKKFAAELDDCLGAIASDGSGRERRVEEACSMDFQIAGHASSTTINYAIISTKLITELYRCVNGRFDGTVSAPCDPKEKLAKECSKAYAEVLPIMDHIGEGLRAKINWIVPPYAEQKKSDEEIKKRRLAKERWRAAATERAEAKAEAKARDEAVAQ